ncbi:MAG: carbamoyl phosphate synthase large subunit, partial [Hyphomicrobiaceae bacterium]|nr:carbamoyl phosphate synthase large subunit [Hyphomicrobiaceae bacterium]
FAFEKFPEADDTLTTQMKSVGETMAIGSTFKESFQKALRGLEVGSFGFGCDGNDLWGTDEQPDESEIKEKLSRPGPQRAWYLRYAIKSGMSVEQIYEITRIDPWFLDNLLEIVETEERIRQCDSLSQISPALVRTAKRFGFSDRQLATMLGSTESEIRAHRLQLGIRSVFKSVDTCAAEFEAYTPYFYSTYETEDEVPEKVEGRKRVMILGGGPNRIGQGIEFDYCCCHASFALREIGYESIMVN